MEQLLSQIRFAIGIFVIAQFLRQVIVSVLEQVAARVPPLSPSEEMMVAAITDLVPWLIGLIAMAQTIADEQAKPNQSA